MSPSTKVPVEIEGRRLTLSNLQKVLYPQTGFAKAQVLDYYTRIAPALLPHLRDRALTLKRYPEGVEGGSFYEKNAPSHRPEWVRTATVASPGSTRNRETIDYVVADELATLIWVANLASLELHTPMWRVSTGRPDLMVVDLDPGPPATIVECCRVACHVRDATGLDWYAKTSGSKGLQLYTAVRDERTSEQTSAEMKALAERLEREQPELVVSRMTKAIRPGKVLLDWSQNSSAKTTVSVYSLRARPEHTVSTPVTWDEVAGCRAPEDLVFRTDDVLARVEEYGDLFAPLL
jgi:bifunctional non-homologous end joining protein LigD